LFEALQSAIPVIGVAKSRYRNDTWSVHVCRGNSRRPLYVTSAGIEIATAAELVAKMHGKYRIPTLLQHVDRLARSAVAERKGA
jgi:deoxyribonuclease V